MLIRSQGKRRLLNFAQCKSLVIQDVYRDGNWTIECPEYIIGTYSTEEKALKVLDMIQDECRNENNTFQMPTDDEVEV